MTGSSASLTLSALRAGRVWLRVAPDAIGGDQDRHLLAREAAFAGLAAAPARLSRSSFRSPFRLSRTKVSSASTIPASRSGAWRIRRHGSGDASDALVLGANPAALGSLSDRLACAKRGAEGQPALLVVQARQRRARERAECLPAGLCTDRRLADRAPCPERQNRRCRSAHSAALRPRQVRSSPARPHPAAVPTAPPRPPRAAPPSDRPSCENHVPIYRSMIHLPDLPSESGNILA